MALLRVSEKKVSGRMDEWASYTVFEVPFDGDDRPRLNERLAGALRKVGLLPPPKVLPGIGCATARLREVRGGAEGGVAVVEFRCPCGD